MAEQYSWATIRRGNATKMGEITSRVVGGVLRDRDRVLLCHRLPDRRWYPDVWDLPGGHLEPWETALEALARELTEELDIRVTPQSCLPLTAVVIDDTRCLLYLIEEWRGTVHNVAPDEHDALGWFAGSALDGLALAHASYPELLRSCLK